MATGLKKMVTEATAVEAAGADQATAEAAYEESHETWETIEGTVKQKEPDLYAQIEEDLTLLKSSAGDPTKAKTAAESLSKSVDAYLVKHPG